MALKNDILALFELNKGEVFSGTELAEKFGVSRNAVWKAINSLKDSGYSIEAVGKKGYKLSADCNLLSVEGIKAFLPSELNGIKLFVYKQTASTNDEAKSFCVNSNSRAVFVAEQQTEGRGRFGRSFYSPPETGLYLSAVFHPNKPIESSALYTAAAAVATARAIENQAGVLPKIKWVNDLYLDNKKICGILTEAITDFETGQVRSMIIGIGINITTDFFPGELDKKAASIGVDVPRCALSASIISELYSLIDGDENFIDEYRKRCFIIGREIEFFDGKKSFNGVAKGIGENCELILKTDSQTKSFSHGEITKF